MARIAQQEDINKDLGLGSRITGQNRLRFLNRDGSFNVDRKGLAFFRSLSPYHAVLTMSWTKFFLLIVASYVLTNVIFAFGYILCGPDALQGMHGDSFGERFGESFFFSVQTVATIGYGRVSPNGMASNLLVVVESLVGLMGFALATGLLFARFSQPNARVVFSRNAIVAPYRGMTALEFRIANERSNQLLEVEATVTLSRLEGKNGKSERRFYVLPLEREKVVFMPLHWTIVHPIDKSSPLHGKTEQEFNDSDPEILIQVKGVDETFAQTVHARSSYKHFEVVWGAKFADMYLPPEDGWVSVDMKKLHEIEPAAIDD